MTRNHRASRDGHRFVRTRAGHGLPGRNQRTRALTLGAGDGHRTRTVSLGICAIRVSVLLDLRSRPSVSDRESPLFAGVNGPLMARRPSHI
jgi:hypothetical protein